MADRQYSYFDWDKEQNKAADKEVVAITKFLIYLIDRRIAYLKLKIHHLLWMHRDGNE